jgi:hypothetical protein
MKKTVSILYVGIILVAVFAMIFLLGYFTGLQRFMSAVTLGGLLVWLLSWMARRVDERIWIASGLLLLSGLIVPTSSVMADSGSGSLSTWIRSILFLLPSIALVNASLLLYTSLSFYFPVNPDLLESTTLTKRLAVIALGLGVILIVRVLYNLYDLTVWDNTYDPLEYIWLVIPIAALIVSAFVLTIAFRGKRKLTGLLYLLLISGTLILLSGQAQKVDYRQVTLDRAERIVGAIESYRAREGRYPESLALLTPRDIFSLPKPMIIYGQGWCYQSNDDSYRFGYMDREHWSDPRLIGHIYKSVGKLPDPTQLCSSEFAVMQQNHPDYPYSYWKESE